MVVGWCAQLEVREGFDTTFNFRITEASVRCDVMDDEYTHCRSRGGDGFALVLQGDSPYALGDGGMGLGYQVRSRARGHVGARCI
jgi:hypothetical protein